MRAAGIVATGYAAFVAFNAWWGGLAADGSEDSRGTALSVLYALAGLAASVLAGATLGPVVLGLILGTVVLTATVGELAGAFGEELRVFGWMVLTVVLRLLVTPGLWLRHRRQHPRRTRPPRWAP